MTYKNRIKAVFLRFYTDKITVENVLKQGIVFGHILLGNTVSEVYFFNNIEINAFVIFVKSFF